MATPNPLAATHSSGSASSVSKKVFSIAGILTTVYGLEELPPHAKQVACLWLLHPRLQTQEIMLPMATAAVNAWNKQLKEGRGGESPKGLIAVSFDQRNHGSRQADGRANGAWREGNPSHAQDMFSIYHGTAADASHLISYLPAYVFPLSERKITTNLALGVSLGGHAAWHCVLHDERISAAVVVIGCPDFTRLMKHRAEKSKLKSWVATHPPGCEFIGSADFPEGLVEAVAQWDPAGLLTQGLATANAPTQAEKARLRTLLRRHLGGKRILNLSGGADKLVPYACGEPFLQLLKGAIHEYGGVLLEDLVFEGVGHAMAPAMASEAVRFICDALADESSSSTGVTESRL